MDLSAAALLSRWYQERWLTRHRNALLPSSVSDDKITSLTDRQRARGLVHSVAKRPDRSSL
jgi:hypothetical protein